VWFLAFCFDGPACHDKKPWLTVPEVSAPNLKNGFADPEDFMKMRGRSSLFTPAIPGGRTCHIEAQATFSHS